jgi:hypothetical protein
VKSPRDARAARVLAIGGAIGPLAFVTTWALAGSATPGYSAVNDAISDLAATHAPQRSAMTLGFVAFGTGVTMLGLALRAVDAGPAWASTAATAGFTFAVAATPLGAPTRDVVHGTFASLGYVTLAAAPLLASRKLARAGRPGWARYSRFTGALAGTCLLASALGPLHGLFQRGGLTIGDAWLIAIASQLMLGRDLFAGAASLRDPRDQLDLNRDPERK